MCALRLGKTEIRIYGGSHSIGGNCIVVRSPSFNVMLDQGVNFAQLERYYGISIQPDTVEELREMGVLPPREAYDGVDEIYVTHLHLDHLGSLNIPGDIQTYLPSREVAEAISRSWWFGWKQHLIPKTQSFDGFRNIPESKHVKYSMVSHSAYPSYALRIDADDATILYTGDLRIGGLHRVSGSTLEGLGKLAEGGVDVLIVEGTNFGRRMNYLPPEYFKDVITGILEKYGNNTIFVSAHPIDLEATLSLLELLWERGFTPVFLNQYYAKLLDVMITVSKYTLSEEREIVFTPRSSKIMHYDNIEIAFLEEIKDRKLAVFLPLYSVKDMIDILKTLDTGAGNPINITVLGEPLSEEWIIEENKIENWLKLFGITSLRIHVSGHYYPYEFRDILSTVKPRKLIPIHTTAPKAMLELFKKYSAPASS